MEEKTVEKEAISLAEKVRSKVSAFINSATHEAEKVPLDKITASTITDLIVKNGWQYQFSIVDILRAFGYIAPLEKTDYREKFPNEYKQARISLHELSAQGSLKLVTLEKPDSNKETIHYQPENYDELKNIAALSKKPT